MDNEEEARIAWQQAQKEECRLFARYQDERSDHRDRAYWQDAYAEERRLREIYQNAKKTTSDSEIA